MKNKLVYFIISFCVILTLMKIDVVANGFFEVKNSTPEKTLNTYIDALKEGNLYKVLKCYYSDKADFKFNLPRAIKIEKYEIVKKKIYTDKMADRYKAIPKAKAGDVELDVKEYIDNREEMFTYLFRKINQEWRIISHSAWNQQD